MQSITFTCETITPMFLAGADGTTPELRAPSIKGALRFWWRAMNGHLSLEDLRRIEGEIFGSTNQKSKIIIIANEQPKTVSENEMLPHKTDERHRSPKSSFSNGSILNIQLRMFNTIDLGSSLKFTVEQLKNLFTLTATLGGFGKRNRRGMGSFKIVNGATMPSSLQDIETLLNSVVLKKDLNKKFILNSHSNTIEIQKDIESLKDINHYPTIQQIEIGKNIKSPKEIGLATHNVKIESNEYQYKATIGAGNPRFASPVYVSILADNKPIITTLKTVPPERNQRDFNINIQTTLKNRIL